MLLCGLKHLLSGSPECGNLPNKILRLTGASGGRNLASTRYSQP
jgi:hypothetical protein